MNKRNVLKGFIANGMIDSELNYFPDFEILLRTCKIRDLPKDWENLILDNFSVLYKSALRNGEISEELFN